MVAAAVVGSAVVGGVVQAGAASDASSAQTNAANQANATQNAMFNTTQANLQPYMRTGAAANDALSANSGLDAGGNPLTSALLKPISMNETDLQQTPGYQFNLKQGLKATQNSAAARGLGVSGAAQKGAASYATGLADNTYQNQFSNAVTNQTNAFNRLSTLSQTGQNAAAGLGGIGQQTAANIGNNTTSAGNASAASTLYGANAIANSGNSLSQNLLTQQYLNGMYGEDD